MTAYQLQILHTTRHNISALLSQFGLEKLNQIPTGFSNNLLWNAGHVLATQQLLLYNLSGLQMSLSTDFIEEFRKGSRPEGPYGQEMAEFILGQLQPTARQLALDMEGGLFRTFKAYPTSYGIELKSAEQALQFNNVHEGLHLGYMMALRKHLR